MAVLFSLEIRHSRDAKEVAWGTGAVCTRVHQTTPDPRAENSPGLWESYPLLLRQLRPHLPPCPSPTDSSGASFPKPLFVYSGKGAMRALPSFQVARPLPAPHLSPLLGRTWHLFASEKGEAPQEGSLF